MKSLLISKEQEDSIKNMEPTKCKGWKFYNIHTLTEPDLYSELGHAIKEFLKTSYNNHTEQLLA